MILPRDPFESELAAIWELVTGVQPVGVTDAFFDLGGDSLAAEWMLLEIEKKFRRQLPQRVLYEARTIAEMAALLREEGWATRPSALVALQPNGSRPPLFCFPPLNAISAFRSLAGHLGPNQPLYALQATPEGDHNPFDSIEAEAAYYISEITAQQPAGPYYLTGWSYGGIVAFETAQQLSRQQRCIAFLGILDIGFKLMDLSSRLGQLRRRLEYVAQLGPSGQWQRVRHRLASARGATAPPDPRVRPATFPLPAPDNDSRADHERARRYKPIRYDGRVTLFRTRRTDYERGSTTLCGAGAGSHSAESKSTMYRASTTT